MARRTSKQTRPELLPPRFPYSARCTSDRAAIAVHIVTPIAGVKLPALLMQQRSAGTQALARLMRGLAPDATYQFSETTLSQT
jgi:hypothetical protein